MMNDSRKDRDYVRAAIDDCLSGVDQMPSLRLDIIRKARGEVKVKKKLSVGFVLVMILVLVTVAALAAVTWSALYEKAIEKEGQSGLIQDWSASDKVALVDWMAEAGAKLDDTKVAQLHDGSLNEEQQGVLAMELIQDYFPARDGILTSVDIIAKEKGPIENWSLEDKAWFSEMLLKYQPEEVGSVNLLPDGDDITQEQAIEIMYAYYEKQYGLTRNDFDETKMTVSFSENTWDDGSGPERLQTWNLDLWLKNDSDHPLSIAILPDGTVKQAGGPYIASWRDEWYSTLTSDNFWTIQGLYHFEQKWKSQVETLLANGEEVPMDLQYLVSLRFSLPKDDDITRDEAYSHAEDAILNSGFSQTYLGYYGTREAYLLNEDGDGYYKFAFTYWVYPIADERRQIAEKLHGEGEIPQKIIVCINASTGELISLEQSNALDGSERFGI
jgi:hypothetical protein